MNRKQKQLLLVGGGHTHALILKRMAMEPWLGTQVTLVSENPVLVYSGMLPGAVSGFYPAEATEIDLWRLAAAAGAKFVHAAVSGLDVARKEVFLPDRPPLSYDLVSLNTGGVPRLDRILGAESAGVPLRPAVAFLAFWRAFALDTDRHHLGVTVVGGGAGGVEIILAMRKRLGSHVPLHLVQATQDLASGLAPLAQRHIVAELAKQKIQLHLALTVRSIRGDVLLLETGQELRTGAVFWATGVKAPDWLKASGLALDAQGFIRTNASMQSISHADVFAAGDVAVQDDAKRPRAGVFAVRQAKPLARNLQLRLAEKPLQAFVPQKRFLVLLGTADDQAIAARGAWASRGKFWWALKRRIDQKFMQSFLAVAPMAKRMPAQESKSAEMMRCKGCAAKLPEVPLRSALSRLEAWSAKKPGAPTFLPVKAGLAAREDAAVIDWPKDQRLIQSVDFMPALIRDEYLFGRIAAVHAASDIFAMGASPHSALAVVTLPLADIGSEVLFQLLAGVQDALAEMGAELVCGHSAEGQELAIGLTVNGKADGDRVWRKNALEPQQRLILTKALGTGTLFAAAMHGRAKGRWLAAAVSAMLQSNAAAAAILQRFHVRACTDVTGFGLAGHLLDMARSSGVNLAIELAKVPRLPGADELLQQGLQSTLHAENARVQAMTLLPEQRPRGAILFDPQTSGGLLAGVLRVDAEACLDALHRAGCHDAAIIGEVQGLSLEPKVSVHN